MNEQKKTGRSLIKKSHRPSQKEEMTNITPEDIKLIREAAKIIQLVDDKAYQESNTLEVHTIFISQLRGLADRLEGLRATTEGEEERPLNLAYDTREGVLERITDNGKLNINLLASLIAAHAHTHNRLIALIGRQEG